MYLSIDDQRKYFINALKASMSPLDAEAFSSSFGPLAFENFKLAPLVSTLLVPQCRSSRELERGTESERWQFVELPQPPRPLGGTASKHTGKPGTALTDFIYR